MSFEAFFGETRTWAGVIHVYSYVRGGIPPPLLCLWWRGRGRERGKNRARKKAIPSPNCLAERCLPSLRLPEKIKYQIGNFEINFFFNFWFGKSEKSVAQAAEFLKLAGPNQQTAHVPRSCPPHPSAAGINHPVNMYNLGRRRMGIQISLPTKRRLPTSKLPFGDVRNYIWTCLTSFPSLS